MHSILKKIIKEKKRELKILGKLESGAVKPIRNNSFVDAITNAKGMAIIGEIKFSSPTTGALGLKKHFSKRIIEYEKAGLDALSIVTEKSFFNGDISFIKKAKREVKIPILQKDFVFEKIQIEQAKANKADALLLIARIVSASMLRRLVKLCFKMGIEPIVEICSKDDLEKAIATTTNIIAVNARNLETFKVNVEDACILIKQIPVKYIKLGFSGVLSKRQVIEYKKAGAKGVLVGTSLMKTDSIVNFVQTLKI